jgi:23S rRNA (uracil1939-C5)-methyltransferase
MSEGSAGMVIDSLAHDGRGVAHVDGKAVFVSGALPGERVTVGRRRRHRSYDEAELISVESPSEQRVVPRCAQFGVCGGCSLQHLEPTAQLRFKEQHLLEQLERIGGVRPESVLPPLAGDSWSYRRRARLGAKFVPKKGRVLVGFRERAAPYIADVQRCEILAAPVDGLIEPLSALLTGLGIRSRVPQIEVAVADNATALIFRVLDAPSVTDREQLAQFGARYGVGIYLQPGGMDTIAALEGQEPQTTQPLFYRLPEFDLTLQFEPADFVQINGPLNRAMVRRAVDLLACEPGDRVLDLFCGLGNFTLALARHSGSVLGVEGDAGLVRRAQGNAARNGIGNVEFRTANLFEVDDPPPWMRESFDRVLLDPPRAGAREVLPWIGRSGVGRVVYISCHPASLARDSGILVQELGFKLEAAGALDMFPHTAHVESMAVFVRR